MQLLKKIYNSTLVRAVLAAALVFLYLPVFSYVEALVNPEVLNIAGIRVTTNNGWRLDADYEKSGAGRTVMLSRVNVMMPWTKKRRIVISDGVPKWIVPDEVRDQMRGSAASVSTAIGKVQIAQMKSLPGGWLPGALSGTKVIGFIQPDIFICMAGVEDLVEAFLPQGNALQPTTMNGSMSAEGV